MNNLATETFDYDVALSYAAEDRKYVQAIAEMLKEKGVQIFYDEFATVDLWGRDLYVVLDEVYRKRARFVIVFVSFHYVSKPWTRHERMSAQARAFTEEDPYFLPVRLDDSELPGLRPTIGYIDARSTSQEQLVALVRQKVSGAPGATNPEPKILRVPRTPDQQRELLAQRPPGWEYLFYAGVLWQRRNALEAKWRDHELGYGTRTGRHYDLSQVFMFLQNSLDDLAAGPKNILKVLTPEAQLRAFGAMGEPGNAELIEHIATRLVGMYEQMMDVASTLRGAGVPEELREVVEATARLADQPLQEIRDFIDRFVAEADPIPERLAEGQHLEIEMSLTMTIDPEALERQSNEMDIARVRLGL
ncbi:toll/interleukin-1 receptor domain-containing protein [Streptomyces pseudovenezuelae]|uniref:TIR domain-containing protein n=1 Tax=Streptomyces pseudovenezuelae TaxID=67350 RepID=A0ABT6LMS4_9ACTN|nr:TIR domain-containing protein [Streptomyces pseudovenezuelae]MDH6217606.1 hypothetical protein [Streptomyces pseudovenezuelae]